MKKLIAVILAVMSFTVIQTSAAVERVYYDFSFADGYYFDLKTGVGKSDARFAVSSRKPVKSDSITIVGANWHHILWWGDNNQYIGYHNSSKSSYKTNLFNAFETSYSDIDVIDNDSFVTTQHYNLRIFNNDWVLDNIIPGATYTMSYDVTLLYKPDSPTKTLNIAHFRLFNSGAPSSIQSIYLAYGLSPSQYLDLEVGETVHVENTTEIPGTIDGMVFDLSGYRLVFALADHEGERPIMRVDNVRFTVGDTIPTGQYFGTAGPIVTPPEGAKYFHLQVCKERDNLIDFIEYPPQGALDVIDKNSFRSDYRREVIYEDLEYGVAPRLILDYGHTYYIRYSLFKLAEDGGNGGDVGIFFWWSYGLSWEDIMEGGAYLAPPKSQFRLAPGISDDWFQELPVGENALVEGTFIANDLSWPGSPYHGHEPYPRLWVYTTGNGANMIFDNIYILPADSYDAQIEIIREDPAEVFERFSATQVYYEREAITPPEGTNLAERVEAWLDNNNLNNNLFKTLVSIVVIVAVVIGLALLKAPGVAIIFSVVLIFALGVMFGWIPMWLVIPIALLCLGLIFLKLKAGGGGIDESD